MEVSNSTGAQAQARWMVDFMDPNNKMENPEGLDLESWACDGKTQVKPCGIQHVVSVVI